MTKLFATHCIQTAPHASLSGQYDPEQELWVADNQPQGADLNALRTVSTVDTGGTVGTLPLKYCYPGGGPIRQIDGYSDHEPADTANAWD